MFYLKIADLIIKIDNKYDYIKDMCRDYITDADTPDIEVIVSDEDIMAEQTDRFALPYLESLAVYRKIAESLPAFDGAVMHGAVIDVDNTGYAFLARSGTGKTTHISLWHRLYKDKMTVINGDKPIIRFVNGKVYAYGTPWAGKEGLQVNSKTELKNICFIERCKENFCEPVSEGDALSGLMAAVYLDKGFDALNVISSLLNSCRFFKIKCNMDISAAKTAFEGMNQ